MSLTSFELRKKFLEFFNKREHTIVPSSSLLPSDPSVLLTTAGMQQFKEYFLAKKSPYGNRVVSFQKCFRTSDIEEIGDKTHLTFFEMLGNFSFGDYFKKEAINWGIEFLIEKLGLEKKKIWFTVFKGNKKVPKDLKSKEIIKEMGFPEEKISEFGEEDNFWGPTGETGPCGPTCEIHYELTQESCKKGKECVPNCDCGRFIELWNLVFNQYNKKEDGKLEKLKQQGVDTGAGLERVAMVCQNKSSVFETDLFEPIIEEIGISKEKAKEKRIIADHIKGAVFLISDGVFPSNLKEGYVLRRILRRATAIGKLQGLPDNFFAPLAKKIIETYQNVYPELKAKQSKILTVIQKEREKFEEALEEGIKETVSELERTEEYLSGKKAFYLYSTYGIPLEFIEELAQRKNKKVKKEEFKEASKKHKEVSRAGAEKKFGGVGIEQVKTEKQRDKVIQLHTATHLLQAALREVLGDHVRQKGSDISPQRLRFDFSHSKKLTKEEIKKVEDLVNKKIKDDLEVKKTEMSFKKALESEALAVLGANYPEKVSVYSVDDFSKEICAGPHVNRTSKLGKFKIIKEESSSASVRRIRAILK